jgi:hypothetical protein
MRCGLSTRQRPSNSKPIVLPRRAVAEWWPIQTGRTADDDDDEKTDRMAWKVRGLKRCRGPIASRAITASLQKVGIPQRGPVLAIAAPKRAFEHAVALVQFIECCDIRSVQDEIKHVEIFNDPRRCH